MNGNQSSSRNTALLGGLLALGLILGNWILGAQIKATRLSDRYVTVKGLVPGIMYKFNGLNSIKPDMITEAPRNASAAADRFAADSNLMKTVRIVTTVQCYLEN
jgi:hypothetical protein